MASLTMPPSWGECRALYLDAAPQENDDWQVVSLDDIVQAFEAGHGRTADGGTPPVDFEFAAANPWTCAFEMTEDDTIGDLKKLIAAQTGTKAEKIVLKKWYNIFKDQITLADYEIHDGMNLELYYQ